MKKIVGILISVSLIVTAGVPAFAETDTETVAAETDVEVAAAETDMEAVAAAAEETEPYAMSTEETEPAGDDDTIHYIDGLSLELSYDDRYDLSDLDESISPDEEYVIFQTVYEKGQGITSYNVSQGEETDEVDEALLTLESDSAGTEDDTEVIATGIGSGTVWLVRADQEEALRKALDGGEMPDGDNPQEAIDVYEIAVTVEPATLTLMLLAGQSNMEGYCSSNTGYNRGASIACEEGAVYSTYVPWSSDIGKNITGISFGELCTTSNYNNTAGDFVASSLQGEVTASGELGDPSNMSGGTLEYSLYSLTSAGSGKTGPDSGLAYEWNRRTGDKVWVVNAAYGATSITRWVPGADCYERMMSVWKNVKKTYEAEIAAGHYIAGEKLMFWLQGEADNTWDAAKYESYFAELYDGWMTQVEPDGMGIIMVRSSAGSHQNEEDLKMTGPRIAQYWLGSGNGPDDNVFVVSNANEQWVSDSGVKAYFQSRYGSALSYPMQSGSASVPTTVNEVHYDIHYSQLGHNENGITAADGMVEALSGSSAPESVSWRDGTGQTVSSLTLELVADTGIAVPVADPVYTAKQLTWDSVSGSVITYDAASCLVQAANESAKGTENLVAYAGSKTATLSVTVSTSLDLRNVAGANYTGLYKYNGIWWYLKDGIIQLDYESVVKNEYGWWYVKNGRVDFTYTGFAKNENGWWYIEDGNVTFAKNGVLKDQTGAIDDTNSWYYVVGSKVQMDFTGLADYSNENGWWYIKDGKVDFTANTVAKNKNGWYYVTGGKVDFSYNGFSENSNGKWYCEGGKVTFNKNSVLKDTPGAIGTAGTWYYVVGSKVQTNFTGLADYRNDYGWWYIRDGKVDFSANTVAKNKNGWYYVLDGKVQFGFTGLADYRNDYGWWYILDGKVDFSYNGIAQNHNGWFYLEGGKVDFTFTGRVVENGTFYSVTDGKVNR